MADELGHLDTIAGRAGDVAVILHGLTYRDTRSGRRFPYGEFGPDFIEALHRGLVRPRGGGLFRTRISCPSCDTELDDHQRVPVDAATDVALRRIPPIGVDVTMPGLVCPRCGTRVVCMHDRNVESDLSDALIAAFDSAGVKPG
jgi:hypothetical protein